MKFMTNKGFSLVEVLIALLVLSLGLIAMAKFQTSLLRSAADSAARAEALALAEEKMEDLRAFNGANDCADSDTWTSLDYCRIATNAGGSIPAVASYAIDTGTVKFSRTWTVTEVTVNGQPAKQVSVKVAWQDLDGDQEVELGSAISLVKPGGTIAATGSGSNEYSPPGILAELDDGGDRYDEVDAGHGYRKRTGKPLPEVYHTGDYTKVEFDVITYVNNLNPTLVRQESYTTVNCLCTFNGTGSGFTPGYTLFENATQTIHDQVDGFIADKVVGVPANNQQPPECDICCRDHHDGGTDDNNDISYIPEHTGSGDHEHYNVDGDEVTSGDYLEACRIKIIDGKERVFQDWRLKNITTMTDDYLDLNGSTYSTEVSDFILDVARGNTPTAPDCDGCVEIGNGGNEQLEARAIYMDTVYESDSSADVSYADFIAASGTNASDAPLLFIPFVEINLTKLANWRIADSAGGDVSNLDPCPPSGPTANIICVTSEPIVDESLSENNYSRGLVYGLNEGEARAISYANPDNTGITGSPMVNPNYETTPTEALESTDIPEADYVTVTVASADSFFSVSGEVSFCAGMTKQDQNALYDVLVSDGVDYSGTDDGGNAIADTCTVNNQNGPNGSSYSCDGIANGSSVTVNFPSSVNPTLVTTAPPYTTATTGVNFEICNI